MNMHVNPFLRIQNSSGASVLLLVQSMACFRISAPDHPLFGVSSPGDLHDRLERLPAHDLDLLVSSGIIGQQPFDRRAILAEELARVNDPTRLHITVNPTMRCNNACLYCCQDHDGQPSMSGQDWDALRRHVRSRLDQGVAHVRISLMGGEPTLEFAKVVRFLSWVSRLCADRGTAFHCNLTTNGRLLASLKAASELARSGVDHVQLTIDGPAHLHDRLRPGISGRPTHGQAMQAVRNLCALTNGPSLQIRTNHTRWSIEPAILKEHLDQLKAVIGRGTDVTIAHDKASDLGKAPCRDMLLDDRVFDAALPELHRATFAAGLRVDVSGYQAGSMCYAGRSNHFAVYPGGIIRKCTVSFEDRNHVGRLLPDGRLELNQQFEQWTVNTLDHPQCMDCPAAIQCLGNACPARRLARDAPVCHPRFLTDMPIA